MNATMTRQLADREDYLTVAAELASAEEVARVARAEIDQIARDRLANDTSAERPTLATIDSPTVKQRLAALLERENRVKPIIEDARHRLAVIAAEHQHAAARAYTESSTNQHAAIRAAFVALVAAAGELDDSRHAVGAEWGVGAPTDETLVGLRVELSRIGELLGMGADALRSPMEKAAEAARRKSIEARKKDLRDEHDRDEAARRKRYEASPQGQKEMAARRAADERLREAIAVRKRQNEERRRQGAKRIDVDDSPILIGIGGD
jgi:hypothetical protein